MKNKKKEMKQLGFLEKIFGDLNEKEVKKLEKVADQITALDEETQQLTDDQLREKTETFKKRFQEGESIEDLLVEAFAVVREGAWRSLGMKHFKVQLIGGIALSQGSIAEMKTGEGKTLVATLAAYLNAISGKGVHVVTVNDYLAKRDMEWMGKLYRFLGLSVGCIVHGLTTEQRRDAYNCDITYGTNNEFGFDYLKDNMVTYKQEMVQRPLNFAIIDEVDSILVDEARTPLVISGAGEKSTALYKQSFDFTKKFKMDEDFTYEEKDKAIALTDEGVQKSERFFGLDNLADPQNMEINHHIIQSLKAQYTMKRDVDYVVKDGEIVIVDDFTGRLMFGRRYSEGLHQAIEAKEKLEVRSESKTLASITLQNYFRMYQKLSGMTGTAKTEEEEFKQIYNMDVLTIPTNKPIARQDLPDSIYATEKGKYMAMVEQIEERHKTGQPILVGTISIERSELVSQLLKRKGVVHKVLNAKQHQKEAEIVAEAGRLGSITIATNMAGRGTDIILGGNPEFEAKQEMRAKKYEPHVISIAASPMPVEDEEILKAREVYQNLFNKYQSERQAEHDRVLEVGGLHIIGTERHESRRIDNQLRGRAGRQGDPGSSQFFISLEDELMRLFGGERIQGIVAKLGVSEDEPIEAGMLTKSIENAQKKVEGRNFSIRKYVLQYDDIMNKQREIIYKERQRVLQGENLREHVESMIETLVNAFVDMYTADAKYPEEWDMKGLEKAISRIFLDHVELKFDNFDDMTIEDLRAGLMQIAKEKYDAKEEEIQVERMRELERVILLRIVDNKWMDHIDAMDQLKQGIGLRAIGNEDPVRAYQNEGFDMFDEMINSIQEDTVRYVLNVTITTSTERKQVAKPADERKDEFREYGRAGGSPQKGQMPKEATKPSERQKQEPVKKEKTVGRNDPCPCGSGKKYKKCCGKEEQ